MSGVKKSFWLDAPQRGEAQSGSIPGTVVGAGENGTVKVAVGGAENVVNVPSGGGVFEHGSEVRVQVDTSGAPTGLQDAGVSVTEGGLVYAGAEGRRLREVAAEASAAKAAWDRAQRELEAAKGQTERDLASLRDTLQGAQADAQNARLMFSTSEKDPKSYFRDINATPPVGAVYEQRGEGGAVENRFRWDGRNWVEFNIASSSVRVDSDLWTRMLHVAGSGTITGDLIAGGSVTADKIVASKELSAKVAKFEESVVSRLRAERAVITGDLIADKLVGKSVEGGRLTVNASNASGEHRLSLEPSSNTADPLIVFRSKAKGGEWHDKVVMGTQGMNVFAGPPGARPTFMSWLDMGAAPYYRFVSGNTYMNVPKTGALRVPLAADTSARGAQIKVINGNSLLVPRSGRYRVTAWACIASSTWDTVTQVVLLRGDAQDATWGDLYGYAIGPNDGYSTPQFTGLIDIKGSERVSLGLRTNGTSVVRDYRFEVEFVCPL